MTHDIIYYLVLRHLNLSSGVSAPPSSQNDTNFERERGGGEENRISKVFLLFLLLVHWSNKASCGKFLANPLTSAGLQIIKALKKSQAPFPTLQIS